MAFRNLVFSIVRCEGDVGVLLTGDIMEARRHAETFRRVAQLMATKSGVSSEVAIGMAVFDGAAPPHEVYRSDVASMFIQRARSSVE
jgi:hypothetical protein